MHSQVKQFREDIIARGVADAIVPAVEVHQVDKKIPPASDFAPVQPKPEESSRGPENDVVIHDDALLTLTESNLARAFARKFTEKLRFNHTSGKWHVWSGTHWSEDTTRLVFDWARRFTEHLNTEGKARWAKASVFAAVERIATADRAFACTASEFDPDRWVIGTPAGVVDLRTGNLRPAKPEDMVTKVTGCAPAAPGTPAPKWDAFLRQATNHDEGLMRFLQQVCGYALTGETNEHILLFIFGPGGNGKGVFIDTITAAFGHYAQVAAMETFTASSHQRHSTELAHLKGARLITASETEANHAWAESRIKMLTGQGSVRARFLFREEFEFEPEFKLVIIGNHKPRIQSVDEAMRRRLNLVDFKYKPPTPNPLLRSELRAELPQVLRWCIDGCLDWQSYGLVRPQCVVEATSEYFAEQDLTGQWIEERCQRDAQFTASATLLFKNWAEWAKAAGEDPGTQTEFGQRLNGLGIYAKRKSNGVQRLGIRLNPTVTKDPRCPGDWDE